MKYVLYECGIKCYYLTNCDEYDFLVQLMTDVVGNLEEERRAEFYNRPWSQEAVSRYFYCKVSRNDAW